MRIWCYGTIHLIIVFSLKKQSIKQEPPGISSRITAFFLIVLFFLLGTLFLATIGVTQLTFLI